MRTGKSISNISYQSPSFFALMVENLQKADAIGPCFWVAHKGEEGDKDHIHMVLLGGIRTYETKGLESLFGTQIFQDGSKGSLTQLWRTTKDLNDWLLYAIHEPTYLLRKGEVRDFSYEWSDIRCGVNDGLLLNRAIIEAKRALEAGGDKVYRLLRIAVKNNMTWREIVLAGVIPVNCLGSAYRVYELMKGRNSEDN